MHKPTFQRGLQSFGFQWPPNSMSKNLENFSSISSIGISVMFTSIRPSVESCLKGEVIPQIHQRHKTNKLTESLPRKHKVVTAQDTGLLLLACSLMIFGGANPDLKKTKTNIHQCKHPFSKSTLKKSSWKVCCGCCAQQYVVCSVKTVMIHDGSECYQRVCGFTCLYQLNKKLQITSIL